jgi:hypothetical protein
MRNVLLISNASFLIVLMTAGGMTFGKPVLLDPARFKTRKSSQAIRKSNSKNTQ